MLDRASGFTDPETIELLRASFVPVALDVWFHERREDAEGVFYRSVVAQREGYEAGKTTQGFYVFGADGKLVRGWNHRDAARLKRALRDALKDWKPAAAAEALNGVDDRNFTTAPPHGAVVIDVFAKITRADWPKSKDAWASLLRTSIGRDHLWILADEIKALRRREMPRALALRIARFHCIDNTRGEPPMWAFEEVKRADFVVKAESSEPIHLTGSVELATKSGDRRYAAAFLGRVAFAGEELKRFEVVARGTFQGQGTYTQGAPPGPFTLALAFRLAAPSESAKVPPQGFRDRDIYLSPLR